MTSNKCSDIISLIIWALPYNQNSLKCRNNFYDIRNCSNKVNQSLGNSWSSEKKSEIIFFKMMYFSDRLDIRICKIFLISMIIVHTIVYGNEFMVRESKINSEIVFSIIGHTNICMITKCKNQWFKKFIEKSFPSHKSISKFTEYFMNSQNNFFASDTSYDTCRNSRIVRSSMDKISSTGKFHSFSKTIQHKIISTVPYPIDFHTIIHFFIFRKFFSIFRCQNFDFISLSNQSFDEILKKYFHSSNMWCIEI